MGSIHLLRIGSLPALSRRELLRRTAATAAVAALASVPLRPAAAATTVNWLGWQGYDEPLQADDFIKKNDIQLAATYLGSNDEIVTKLSAGAPLDIVTPYMGYVPQLREAGLIQPIDTAQVPNLPNVLPVFRDDSNLFHEGVHWSVPITWGGGPMNYDPAVLTPTSWFDLEKPEYKGKIAMFDDAVGMMLTASIMVSGAKVASLLTPKQLEEVKKYLIKLKKEHARAIFASYGEGGDAMARGEVVMTLGGAEWLKAVVMPKKKTEYTYPKEGCFAFVDSYVIPKAAPHPKLSHAMANQMLTLDSQLLLTKNNYAVITEAAIKALPAAVATMYPYSDIAAFQKKCTFFPMAPLVANKDYASWPDWIAAWQEVLAA